MATADETNTQQLPTFSNTKVFEQLAIQLRSEGKSYEEIRNTINEEYKLAYKQQSIREWFMAGGRLEQAYLEYNEWHADQSVIRAKLKIKKSSETAADTLDELMTDKFDGRVRYQASKTILGKYIPDRQVVVDERNADELPSAIADAGDKVLTGNKEDGQKPVVDAPESEPPSEEPGPTSS